VLSKEQLEEAMQYLRAHDILLYDGLIDGEPAYKLNGAVAKTILGLYDKFVKMPDRPESPLTGALMLAVLGLNGEGFAAEQLAAACSVLKPFAEQLIKQRGNSINTGSQLKDIP
jgi:hypothetical protein